AVPALRLDGVALTHLRGLLRPDPPPGTVRIAAARHVPWRRPGAARATLAARPAGPAACSPVGHPRASEPLYPRAAALDRPCRLARRPQRSSELSGLAALSRVSQHGLARRPDARGADPLLWGARQMVDVQLERRQGRGRPVGSGGTQCARRRRAAEGPAVRGRSRSSHCGPAAVTARTGAWLVRAGRAPR